MDETKGCTIFFLSGIPHVNMLRSDALFGLPCPLSFQAFAWRGRRRGRMEMTAVW